MMSEKFDPTKHMTKLQGKDYLEVAPRVAWFRSEHPQGRIATEFITAGDYLISQASIYNGDGNLLAQGSATVRAWAKGGAPRDIEKAETAAIGRALAFAGFGTLQAGEDISEGDHLADAPRQMDTQANGKKTRKMETRGEIVLTSIGLKARDDGNPFLTVEVDGKKYFSFTRQPFRDADILCDHWDEPGKTYSFPASRVEWEENNSNQRIITAVEKLPELAKASGA